MIKSFLKDVVGYEIIKKARRAAIKNASLEVQEDNIKKLNYYLHPRNLKGVIVKVEQLNHDVKKFTIKLNQKIYYEPGTSCNLCLSFNNGIYAREYSVLTEPHEAFDKEEIEIAVKYNKEGTVSKYLFEEDVIGKEVSMESNMGHLKIVDAIDSKNIVMIAGGIGITPFISMLKYIKKEKLNYNIRLYYAVNSQEDLIFKQELDELISSNINIRYFVKDYIDEDSLKFEEDITYLICGSAGLNGYIRGILAKLGIRQGRIRSECFSPMQNDFEDKEVKITVLQGELTTVIPAKCNESIATSLEKAGIAIHTKCRSGFCGYCRAKVISGGYDIRVPIESRRREDIASNYVYSCSTYPKTDMVIRINCRKG